MQQDTQSGWAGWAAFAGFMLIMIGVFHAIAGLAGILKDSFFVLTDDYAFKFDAQTWGWIHLLWGIVVVFAGFGVFRGAVWARTVGVLVALFSAAANFLYLPWYPFWSILIIVVDIFVIYALTAHGRELAQ